MNYDLKLIKKYYGENMAHLCRKLFPTLLEKEGLLIKLIESKFAHSKFLYDDIIAEEMEEEFKDFIFSLTVEKKEPIETDKTVQELMNEAGYDIYECKTEDDINKFKFLYASDEELCTFHGGRLKTCYVFFAVKKNIANIKREDFNNPQRQDAYGTSVISIQFTRGESNTLSIKNRYNHTVSNPDATFKNNLENIIPGLTRAFEKEYGFKINQNANDFKMEDYVMAGDGRFYKYNHELENIYYGPNNVIIDGFKVQEQFFDKSRYIVMEILILDMKEKWLYRYEPTNHDSLPDYIGEIKKISVINLKEKGYKKICIVNSKNEETYLIIDAENHIVGYVNNYIKEINDMFFMFSAHWLKYFEARNLEIIGDGFLNGGCYVEKFIAPKLKEVGDAFLAFNSEMQVFDCPNLERVGYNFMWKNEKYRINNLDKRVVFESKKKYVKALIINKIREIGHRFGR